MFLGDHFLFIFIIVFVMLPISLSMSGSIIANEYAFSNSSSFFALEKKKGDEVHQQLYAANCMYEEVFVSNVDYMGLFPICDLKLRICAQLHKYSPLWDWGSRMGCGMDNKHFQFSIIAIGQCRTSLEHNASIRTPSTDTLVP